MTVLPENQVDVAQKQLLDERRRLERLRGDCATIMRSRFHALRMLWFSLKAVLGMASPSDRYAAWSYGMGPPSGQAPGTFATSLDEAHLITSWKERVTRKPLSNDPIATVVIPAFNGLEYTIRCLQSIASTWFDTLPVQIVVVDDGSSDRTSELLAALPCVDVVRNGANQGFIRACNRGAALGHGKYVCFLNNDTLVHDGWLDHLVNTAERDEKVGIVGAKLTSSDGRLQEAGAIIWRDATGWNYGRGDDPQDPRYNYVRDVDYCSGAALLVRRELFERLGGFCETYIPAYYEDVDLCFSARSLGYRVVYQPCAHVLHFEGVTSGINLATGVKQHQELNRPKFREKWSHVLERHFENSSRHVALAAHRHRVHKTILIIDSYVPMYDRDAGSHRLFQIIRILLKHGYGVAFLPDNYAALQPYTNELQQLGVEVLHHFQAGAPKHEALVQALAWVDVAWICRPELFTKYESVVRRHPRVKLIYDTIDLHFLRKRRESDLFGSDTGESTKLERIEVAAASSADATIVVTESERAVLKDRGVDQVFVVPTLHDQHPASHNAFERSTGILFIGGYDHPPNVDAVKWLCSDIMPLVWRSNAEITVTLIGSNPPDAVLGLASDRVRVLGWVRDVAPYFVASRVFVAPLRYGAGMNGKVGQALSFSLPTVLTTRAADGFGLRDAQNCLIADDAESFASAIKRLYEDPHLWGRLSVAAAMALAPFNSEVVGRDIVRLLDGLLQDTTSPYAAIAR